MGIMVVLSKGDEVFNSKQDGAEAVAFLGEGEV